MPAISKYFNKKGFLLTAAAVLGVAGLLIFVQRTLDWPIPSTVVALPAVEIQDSGNNAYSVSTGDLRRKLVSAVSADAYVTENGAPLPNHVSSSERVRQGAGGDFTFGGRRIWFSTSDHSDPRSNGRVYKAVMPPNVPPLWIGCAWLCLLLGAVLAVKGWFHKWLWRAWIPAPRKGHDPSLAHREWGLDLLRGVAILCVLGRHVSIEVPVSTSQALHDVMDTWQRGGWVGVDLFFVLSGYLVSGLLFSELRKTHQLQIGRFLARRALKIYPAHWFLILTSLVLASLGVLPHPITVDQVMADMLYLQNYISHAAPMGASPIPTAIWTHTWSLAVEEHFYLFLSFVFAITMTEKPVGTHRSLAFVKWLFLALALGCLGLRCLRLLYEPLGGGLNYFYTHTRLDGLMFGVFLRYWRTEHPLHFDFWVWRCRWVFLLVAAAILTRVFAGGMQAPGMLSWGLSLNSVAGSCLVLAFTAWQNAHRFRRLSWPLVLMGRHSYSIYLWHVPVNALLGEPAFASMKASHDFMPSWLTYLAVYFGGTLIGGVFLSKAVEQPFLRLRDRYLPSRSRTSSHAKEPHTHPLDATTGPAGPHSAD